MVNAVDAPEYNATRNTTDVEFSEGDKMDIVEVLRLAYSVKADYWRSRNAPCAQWVVRRYHYQRLSDK